MERLLRNYPNAAVKAALLHSSEDGVLHTLLSRVSSRPFQKDSLPEKGGVIPILGMDAIC